MLLKLIVAKTLNNVIGKDGKMPWRLSTDLKRFKMITFNSVIIMGRKTYESIGKPLNGRENIILTRNKDFKADGCHIVYTFDEAINLTKELGYDSSFVIGGSKLYKDTINIVDEMYITEIQTMLDGDTFFPEFDETKWNKKLLDKQQCNVCNTYDCEFYKYKRK